MTLTFSIDMAPVPKGRPRLGRGGRVYTPEKTRSFEEEFRDKVMLKLPNHTPTKEQLKLSLTFWIEKPKSAKRDRPSVKPDLDNYIKAVTDALNGVLYVDDGQIVELEASKYYGRPEIVVVMEQITYTPEVLDKFIKGLAPDELEARIEEAVKRVLENMP